MAALRLLFCSAAALLLVEFPAITAEKTIEFEQKDANGCLAVMNEARQKADLPGLTKKVLFSQTADTESFLNFVCGVVLKEKELTKIALGTPAIFEMSEEAESYCSAAVKEWQGGYNFFAAKPPVTADCEYPSLGSQHYGFLSLYNPSPGAEGECQIVDCEEKDMKEQEQSQQQLPQNEEEEKEKGSDEQNGAPGVPGAAGRAEGDNAESRKAKALVCLTSPDAFNNRPLFTQEQWDKIAKALSSSTSVAAPSTLAFAAMLSEPSVYVGLPNSDRQEAGLPGVVEDEEGAGARPEETPDSPNPEADEGADEDEAEGKTASALVCLTFPDARDKTPLFSQQHLEKIAKALTNSTSLAAPTSLGLLPC
ncbi:hypothetical protein Emed_002558 [Eimeria media]